MRPVLLFVSSVPFATRSSVLRQRTIKSSLSRLFGRAACVTAAVLLFLFGWVDAGRVTAQTPHPSYTQGAWGQPFDLQAVAVHMSLMHTGRVLYWDLTYPARTFVYNPTGGAIDEVTVPTAPRLNDLFCAGHAFLSDGRLLVAGGNFGFDQTPPRSIAHTNIFTPADGGTGQWEPYNSAWDMNDGRWYPGVVTLPNGEVLAMSGWIWPDGLTNEVPQIWTPSTAGVGGSWRLAVTGPSSYPFPSYVWPHVAPDGRVFISGPDIYSFYYTPGQPGYYTYGPERTHHPYYRNQGTSVMYRPGKVLVAGGGNGGFWPSPPTPTNTAEIIDLDSSEPAWQAASNMNYGRKYLNATILPDGTVLATGGTSAPCDNELSETLAVRAAEIWNPDVGGAGGTWSVMASAQVARLYHSTAVLLPNGRVLTGGSGSVEGGPCDGVGMFPHRTSGEIFSPPYLFNQQGDPATRPVITSITPNPESGPIGYDDELTLQISNVPAGTNIYRVTLVRPGSVTHSIDMNQRFNRLEITQQWNPSNGTIKVKTPLDSKVCPPGYYMMFAINDDGVPARTGVPSEARRVRIVEGGLRRETARRGGRVRAVRGRETARRRMRGRR